MAESRSLFAMRGVTLIVCGVLIVVLARFGNAGCAFDTMTRCVAFGIWPVSSFVLPALAGLAMLIGLGFGGLGAILCLTHLFRR